MIVFFVIQRMLGRCDPCYTALMQILWVASGCWMMLIHDHYHLVCCGQLAGSPLHTNWWIKWGTEPLPNYRNIHYVTRHCKNDAWDFSMGKTPLGNWYSFTSINFISSLGHNFLQHWVCCPAASIKMGKLEQANLLFMDKIFTTWDL